MGRYRVTAKTAVFRHAPGEEFDKDLAPEQERRLVESGAIVKVAAKSTKKNNDSGSAGEGNGA